MRGIFTMKRAFSLLEMTIAMAVFSVLIALVAPILREFYLLHFKALRQNEAMLDLNIALMSVDKLFSHCVQVRIYNEGFHCALRDEESVFDLENHKLFLRNSSLILDKNGTLYSPKSDFKLALQNRWDLFADKEKKIYILKDGKIQTLSLENGKILAPNLSGGIFILLQAGLDLRLEDGILKYELRPRFFSDVLMQNGIMAERITRFTLRKQGENFFLKICTQDEGVEYCLEKILR